jgi:hypothetical protein
MLYGHQRRKGIHRGKCIFVALCPHRHRHQHLSIEKIVALLQPLQPEFEDMGITLAIENHDRFKVVELV